MAAQWQGQIEAITGTPPKTIRSLHGGMIGEVYRVDLNDGRTIVAKVGDAHHGTLDIEGYMLTYLNERSALPVPAVLHSEKGLLLMTYLPGNSHLGAKEQQHAAEILAELHTISAEQFGLERDTLIGPLHQPNPQTDSWIDFFCEHRLLYMARVAHEDGPLSRSMFGRIEKFAAKLERWLKEPPHPSLIHGDMWTTNILTHEGKVSGFVDPAIYYAHPEIELAFSTLFGTFGDPFFRRYNELRPLDPGFFEERRDIYNLYPLLVHVRLFGTSYANSVDSILRRFGF